MSKVTDNGVKHVHLPTLEHRHQSSHISILLHIYCTSLTLGHSSYATLNFCPSPSRCASFSGIENNKIEISSLVDYLGCESRRTLNNQEKEIHRSLSAQSVLVRALERHRIMFEGHSRGVKVFSSFCLVKVAA